MPPTHDQGGVQRGIVATTELVFHIAVVQDSDLDAVCTEDDVAAAMESQLTDVSGYLGLKVWS